MPPQTSIATSTAPENQRNRPSYIQAPMVMKPTMSTTATMVKPICSVSVAVNATPRICIGATQPQRNELRAKRANRIANVLTPRRPALARQTP
ncbi:hypothetical protein D3C87_1546500 [compost metagenome]